MITTSALPEQLERYGETGESQVNIAADGHGSGYATIRDEIERWSRVVREQNIKVD